MPASLIKYTWKQTNESIEVIIPSKAKSLKTPMFTAVTYSSKFQLLPSFSTRLAWLRCPNHPSCGRDNLYIHVSESKLKSHSSILNSNSISNPNPKQPWKSLVFEGTKEDARALREESMDRRSMELNRCTNMLGRWKSRRKKVTLRNQVRRYFLFISTKLKVKCTQIISNYLSLSFHVYVL